MAQALPTAALRPMLPADLAYLAAIYRALGVRTRAEAIARLKSN